MKGVVVAVEAGKMQNKWDGFFFKVQPDPYKGQVKPEWNKFVFANNHDIVGKIRDLSPGEYVQVDQEKDAKGYWQIKDVTRAQQYGGGAAAAPATSAGPTPTPGAKTTDQGKSIARAVALKAGVDVLGKMLDGGYGGIKKGTGVELMADEALKFAKAVEPYLLFEEGMKLDGDDIPFDQDTEFDQESFS